MEPAKTPLDAIDRRLLAALQDDARRPNVQLAEIAGLSPSPCARRVRLLEESGVLQGYHARVDRAAVGLGLTVFAHVWVERHSLTQADAFIAAVTAFPEVVSCHLVSGDPDYLLEIVTADMSRYESEVLRRLLKIPEVRQIRSSFAMRSHFAGRLLPIAP